jgi:hypothetical protein
MPYPFIPVSALAILCFCSEYNKLFRKQARHLKVWFLISGSLAQHVVYSYVQGLDIQVLAFLLLQIEFGQCLLPFNPEPFVFSSPSRNVQIKICKTVILSVVLYGCEVWPLILREGRRLRVFGKRVLRRMFGPKRDEMMGFGENYILRNFISYILPKI